MLQKEDLETLQLAFGEHQPEEGPVESKLASVVQEAAACVDAVAALSGELTRRWNDSAALLDRILSGVDGLRTAAEGQAEAVRQGHSEAARVLGLLAESTDEAREGLERQHPEMVRKMEGLVGALSARAATAQAAADKAVAGWAETLADQEDELRGAVSAAQSASSGIEEVMDKAREAMVEGVKTLTDRMKTAGDKAPVLLDFAEGRVIAPALDAWVAAVKEVPGTVTTAVTALLAELTPRAAESGAALAQGGTGVEAQATAVSTRVAAAAEDLGQRRGGIEEGRAALVEARAPLPGLVAECHELAQTICETS